MIIDLEKEKKPAVDRHVEHVRRTFHVPSQPQPLMFIAVDPNDEKAKRLAERVVELWSTSKGSLPVPSIVDSADFRVPKPFEQYQAVSVSSEQAGRSKALLGFASKFDEVCGRPLWDLSAWHPLFESKFEVAAAMVAANLARHFVSRIEAGCMPLGGQMPSRGKRAIKVLFPANNSDL